MWRNEAPSGFVSTPDGSLNLRTLQAERLVPHLEHLWRADPRARELWAASTTAVSDAWQYLQHHIEDTPLPADLSPAKQAWLDSHLCPNHGLNPWSPLLKFPRNLSSRLISYACKTYLLQT